MDNYAIADRLSLLSKLMEIHGENSFKAKSYAAAAFTIEKLPQPIADLTEEKILKLRGIGESMGSKVMEVIATGELKLLQEYLKKTPEGVLEMMNIKGLGPKKIHTLWKELSIENTEQLKAACESHRLAAQKGFGEKTEQKILESIEFQRQSSGKYLYAQAEDFAIAFGQKLKEAFKNDNIHITGTFYRQMEIVERLEWVVAISKEELKKFLQRQDITIVSETAESLECTVKELLQLKFYLSTQESFYAALFRTGCSEEFLAAWQEENNTKESINYQSEQEIFAVAKAQYVPPFLREKKETVIAAKNKIIPDVIQTKDIKGIIHAHSNWSDGAYTIDEMANACKQQGFEYLVISDHSKAAYYANGLSEQRIREQHRCIDELNEKLKPFKIFKSIECDILNEGNLDYTNKVLATFDLVIASIHSNLDMAEEKAMLRLLGAIHNPYTTILGHMTGRILLKRRGYPINHKTIIDACAENQVVIEINASPSRLDMDWRWIDYALQKNVMLSINPDAHSTEEFGSIKYGVSVAQKGGLTQEQNLSSLSLQEFENFLQQRKNSK